jgi:hypothetical protein
MEASPWRIFLPLLKHKGISGMKTVCAWCGETIKDGPERDPSHGICRQCEALYFGGDRDPSSTESENAGQVESASE